jgi:carbamoylphosphate synthase small subunit
VTGNKDVILLDFNDSFTYNVASELYTLGIKTEVIPLDEIPEKLRDLIECDQKKVIIYGPGPGHPDDYKNLFHLIKRALKKTNLYHVGICLGHQSLISKFLFGLNLKKAIGERAFPFKDIIPWWLRGPKKTLLLFMMMRSWPQDLKVELVFNFTLRA